MKRTSNLFAKILIIFYAIIACVLFVYSYTQVDLSLTLSRVSIWQTIQKSFQYVGYYNRPLSTGIYISIVVGYLLLYICTLWGITKRKIQIQSLWIIIGVTFGIVVFSYPAFSYDLFNHMFTAKTILIYQKNPYLVTPMQFAGVDPWLSFMHWTHVVSIYSPLWIAFTLPLYLLGFGYFLLIMWNFKLFLGASYLLAIWAIGKILKKEGTEKMLLGMALFALNPLVIIESLVSAHNDISMMTLSLLAIVLFSQGKKVYSWFTLAASISIKLMTLTLIPAFFLRWNKWVALIGSCIGLVLFLFNREMMPWYMLWILPFTSLLPQVWWLVVLATGISVGLLLRYTPFLYQGDWNGSAMVIKSYVTIGSFILSVLVIVFVLIYRRFFFKKTIEY